MIKLKIFYVFIIIFYDNAFALIAFHSEFKSLAMSRKNSGIKSNVFKPSFICLKNKIIKSSVS
jgi:hypothetical protein